MGLLGMMDWRRVWATLTLGVALAGLAGGARCEFRPRVSCEQYGKAAVLLINGRSAVRFRAANGRLSPLQRAQITNERLSALVAAKLNPTSIYAAGDVRSAKVCAGEQILCRVTIYDAKRQGTTAIALAQSWAGGMRELLLMPPVVLNPTEVTVPLGENRQVEVGGAAVGPIYVKTDNADIADAIGQTENRNLVISGKQLGKALVEISVQGERATLVVYVKKYAGRVSGVSIGQVTGNPCPASLVCYIARQAVAQRAALEPRASLEIGGVQCPSQALPSGRNRQLKVDVRITGPEYIPFTAKASAEVRNVVLPHEEPGQLFYSNDPESIRKYQPLFAGKIDLDKPVRVLYHHQNEMQKRVHLIVELLNPNDSTARIRVFRGVASPSKDTIVIGHTAGCAFMKDCANDVSVVEAIPPQSRLVLVSDMLGNKDTASGILELRQMDGESTYLRVVAAEPFVDNVSQGSIARAPDPMALRLSDQIYPTPIKTMDVEYIVGSRWAFIPLGKHALTDDSKQKKLYGNYGVTYNINVRVSNPTTEAKRISFVFDPTAGPASGAFFIDGKFASVKYAQPPTEVTLRWFTLNPGETRNCRVMTVPLAGSNYPATLIVKS